LTERATFRLSAPVRDVVIDRTGQHVLALAEWQLSDCGGPGLPGQSLRVWDMSSQNDPDSWRLPISNVCLPNQAVIGIGDLADEGGEPGVRLVTAQGTRWHACPGCPRPNETAQAMLTRLIDSAKTAKAQLLDDNTLRDRYGLRF